MNKRLQVFKYFIADLLSSGLAWFLFYLFRKIYIEYPYYVDWERLVNNNSFWKGMILIPLFWSGMFGIQGLYFNVFRKSRLREIAKVFISSLIGCTILFFVLILDDVQYNYTSYYKSFGALFLFQFTLSASARYAITSITAKKIHHRKIGFQTLIIGGNEKALNLVKELESAKNSAGYLLQGFIPLVQNSVHPLSQKLEQLGQIEDLKQLIEERSIEEVIIADESSDHKTIQNILLELVEYNVAIKVIPDMYNILAGQVKMNSIFHAALIEITFGTMPQWEAFTKRALDIIVSSLVLILGAPMYITLALFVKLSSKGPIFFTQERIGLRGQPFKIIKFRSMYTDAEKHGPALSSDSDSRITPLGKFLRKSRLDETPQFWNVLIGEMSLVGPRPERTFFIDQIIEKSPEYKFLHKVKPGITSWGQVKYGYAENVEEMIERLTFDLIYMENMSLIVDLKIMIHTILVVFQGRGK